MKTIKTLIVDDHPTQIDGYVNVLTRVNLAYEFSISRCCTCEAAFALLHENRISLFELAIIDLNLPPFPQQQLWMGSDLVPLLRTHNAEIKIVFITSAVESLVLYNLIKNCKPSGLFIKSDFDGYQMQEGIALVMEKQQPYYTKSVTTAMASLLTAERYLDSMNRQIIIHLARGIKTKDLPNYLPLSLSAIEKRKMMLKDYFGILNGHDQDIVQAARLRGFI